MVPLPGFTFPCEGLDLLAQLFLLNITRACCLLFCVSFLFQEEGTFYFSKGSDHAGWAYLHAELWDSVMWRQVSFKNEGHSFQYMQRKGKIGE
jgi:hypothetical protein